MEVMLMGSSRLLSLLVLLPLAASTLSKWKELEDSKGRVYYLNRATGATSWHAPRQFPVVQGSCQSACGEQTCESWLIKKADGYGAGHRELQCSLAHASMLEACHERCRHCMVQDTACNHNLQFHCQEDQFHSDDSWSPQRKSWCCQHFQVACNSQRALPAPYDCEAGLKTAHDTWSKAKKHWCCSNEHKGCKYDCFEELHDWQEGWPLQKRAWCCEHAKLGCIKPDESACQLQAGETPAHWTSVRRHYCCRIQSIGCSHTTPTPLPDVEHPHHCTGRHWPLEKIKWCCLAKKIGCKLLASTTTTTAVPDLFDCKAGLKSWEEGWSHRKKAWCCSRKHIGCAFDCRQDLKTWQVSWTGLQKTFCCQHFHVGCVGGCYDCAAGRTSTWPGEKRHWCCRHLGLGCGDSYTPPDCDRSKEESWSPSEREYCCIARGLGCVTGHYVSHAFHGQHIHEIAHISHYNHIPQPVIQYTHPARLAPPPAPPTVSFHCTTGKKDTWSAIQRDWCCKYANTGCGVHQSASHNGFDYDCNSHDDWEFWSTKQKQTCCRDYGIGCPGWSPHVSHVAHVVHSQNPQIAGGSQIAGLATHHFHFHCNADDPAMAAWSVQKQQYCCHDYGVGCPDAQSASGHGWHGQVLPGYKFNCLAGGFPHSWSLPKRAWCCKHESLGCSDAASYDCRPGAGGAWPRAKAQWCCEHENVGCGSLPPRYDCTDGVSRWKEWPRGKREYCCDSVKVGCPKPIQPWIAQLLTPSAQHELHNEDVRRRSRHPKYNCAAGLSHWQDGWSKAKASWCCKYKGYGCPFLCHGSAEQQAEWSPERAEWCCKQHDVACRFMTKYLVNGLNELDLNHRGKASVLAAAGLFVTLVAIAAVGRMSAAAAKHDEVLGMSDLELSE
ncbi:unnamed protein product [Symbiodinium necroappetens]|uniref:WW domain-containing protein n=1 Tax=Symbiodinium necroappetens TaxID=1628268 RepID=A0A813AW77_9DINO|nr:unnamed protein product [Symbiodinium necroappetens]